MNNTFMHNDIIRTLREKYVVCM